jgi:NAD(P)H-flavin reductase
VKTKLDTVEHNGLAVSIWRDDDGTWYYVLPSIVRHDEAGTLHLLVNRAGNVVAQEAKHERS